MTRRGTHRGVTLIEVMALIIVVGIAVPPLVGLTTAASRVSLDDRARTEAVWLCAGVIECVVADAGSGDAVVGFEMMDGAAYLTDPITGLNARVDDLVSPYSAQGITFTTTIAAPRNAAGAVVAATSADATRLVTVEASFTNQLGQTVTVPLSTVVGHP